MNPDPVSVAALACLTRRRDSLTSNLSLSQSARLRVGRTSSGSYDGTSGIGLLTDLSSGNRSKPVRFEGPKEPRQRNWLVGMQVEGALPDLSS